MRGKDTIFPVKMKYGLLYLSKAIVVFNRLQQYSFLLLFIKPASFQSRLIYAKLIAILNRLVAFHYATAYRPQNPTMSKISLIICLIAIVFVSGCRKENKQNTDKVELDRLLTKLRTLAESSTCAGENHELKYIAIGSKGCGGPTGYLGYTSSINVKELEQLAERYTNLQKEYNRKWEIISDCMYHMPPKSVTCENGKPKLIY